MIYKVTKLTKKWNGHGHFKHVIQPTIWNKLATKALLSEWREWCWNTWGPGRELAWAIEIDPNAVWAWDTEYDHRRIYLKTDAELTVFQLKWQK
jgi:hypothetical protein